MKSSIIKAIACIVVLIVGIILTVTTSGTMHTVGIVLAVLGGVLFIANIIYGAVTKK